MPVELLIAPPASGKTQACIGRIRAAQAAQPLSRVWVLVPDRQKAAYFRRRLADSGGGIGVSVGTFRTFYREVLERSGIFVPVVTPALEHRLVQETAAAAADAGELPHYEAIQTKPGFILALQDAFAELRGALVRPERFLEYTRGAAPARRELAVLYDRFLARLQALNWTDQEGQSWLAVAALEGNPQSAADICLVAADGFTSFTGARRRFLRLLSEQAGGMLITLPGRAGSARQVHRHTRTVLENLTSSLPVEVTGLPTPPRLPQGILHLEQHALEPGESGQAGAPDVLLLEAKSQAEEAREALRWIKALNRREGLPLASCAVFAGNLETYQPLLRAAADEFGLRVHFTHPDPLVESPAVIALLSLLSLPGEGFSTRVLLNTLRSPYFNFGLDAQALNDLEKVSMQASIVGGREQWDEAWGMLERARSTGAGDDTDEERRRDDPTGEIDLAALRAAFESFWHLFDAVSAVRPQAEWAAWLEELLEGLRFYENISSERDRAACTALGGALNALVLSESVAGARPTDFARFLTDLQGALNGARLEEPAESRGNALLAGGMVEARGSRFKAVALLGFSEGLFPAVENPDPFLDEELRRDLGLEPRLGREQASIFYQAFTRADAHLLITRPYLTEDGDPWEASPYWLAARKLLAEKSLRRIKTGAARRQADAASPQELLFWAVQQNGLQYKEDEMLASRWQTLLEGREVLDARRARRASGAYEGSLDPLAEVLTDRYSPRHTWSASRFESYGTCPHKFFVETVLKLEAKTPPEPGLDAAQKGSLFHRILELVYKRARSSGSAQPPLDFLDEVSTGVFAAAPQTYGFRPSPLWEVEKAQFVETLRRTIAALEGVSAGWTPDRFEQKFGLDGVPILSIDLGPEKIRLHGVIDRVDRNPDGEVRVIDYKTGGSNLEKADLVSGRRLQLPVYALAAQQALDLGDVVEGFYWKINAAEASAFKLSRFKSDGGEGPEAAVRLALEHIEHSLAGIRSGEFPPRTPRGGCPEYCPAAQWCWRFKAGF